MLTFTLSLFLVPYAVALLFFAVFGAFNVAHLLKHGMSFFMSRVVVLCFLAGAAGIIGITWMSLRRVDWKREVVVPTPFAQSYDFPRTDVQP